jgi:hypothetical protein
MLFFIKILKCWDATITEITMEKSWEAILDQNTKKLLEHVMVKKKYQMQNVQELDICYAGCILK